MTINCKTTDTITLIPFGDVHRDTRSCDEDRWKWFLQNAEKAAQNEHTYFISMGDTHDFPSFSEVKKLKGAALHETTMDKFDEIAEADNRKFVEEIKFMRGKMLGFVEGNHGWVFQNGKTANEDLAERMGTESVGWLCHYTLRFDFKDRGRREQYIDLILCHGKAGGKTEGASLNQLDELRRIFPVADIYCMGHDHQRLAKPSSVIVPYIVEKTRKLKQKRQFLIRAGSFKKGYNEGSHGYEISRLLKPSDLGAVVITIGFHRDGTSADRIIVDIKCTI